MAPRAAKRTARSWVSRAFGETWYEQNTTTKRLFTSYENDTESGRAAQAVLNKLGQTEDARFNVLGKR